MRGWLVHISMKANLLFISQTVATAGVKVMILTEAYLLCVSACWANVSYGLLRMYCMCMFVPVYCWYHLGFNIIVELNMFSALCPYVKNAEKTLYNHKNHSLTELSQMLHCALLIPATTTSSFAFIRILLVGNKAYIYILFHLVSSILAELRK